MNFGALRRFEFATKAAGAMVVAALGIAHGASFAAPTTYNFSSQAGAVFGGAGPATDFINALPANSVVSGSFVYDPAAPLSSTTSSGTSVYGLLPTTTFSFSNLTGSVGGHNFSDPFGFTVVGNNKPFGSQPDVDSVEIRADSSLTSSTTFNFSGFTLAGYTVNNLRLFWFTNMNANSTSDFLSSQALPATLPPLSLGRIALDLNVSSNPAFTSTTSVFFDNVVVTAAPVPEPETYAMMLSGLLLIGALARRRAHLLARP